MSASHRTTWRPFHRPISPGHGTGRRGGSTIHGRCRAKGPGRCGMSNSSGRATPRPAGQAPRHGPPLRGPDPARPQRILLLGGGPVRVITGCLGIVGWACSLTPALLLILLRWETVLDGGSPAHRHPQGPADRDHRGEPPPVLGLRGRRVASPRRGRVRSARPLRDPPGRSGRDPRYRRPRPGPVRRPLPAAQPGSRPVTTARGGRRSRARSSSSPA